VPAVPGGPIGDQFDRPEAAGAAHLTDPLVATGGLLWRCPKSLMLQGYQRNVGACHLDIGVGTGFFLDQATFPGDSSADHAA